jgi:DNA-binding XRE family transcriptional regulator
MAKSPLLPQVVGDRLVVSLDRHRLAQVRADKGLTQTALAAASGLNWWFISQLERGVKKPAINTVLSLASALDVPVEAITVTVPAGAES